MDKKARFNIWYVAAAVIGILLVQYVWAQSQQVERIAYSEFQAYLKEGRIAEISISNELVRGTFKEPLPDGRTAFVTNRVEPDLARDLEQYNVRFTGVAENTFLTTLLSWVLPVLLFFGIWLFLMRRLAGGVGGGFMALGKSKAKIYVETDTKTRFDDVAGVDEAKEELQEVVGFLKDPSRYGRLGGRVPKGVLLVGPPSRP